MKVKLLLLLLLATLGVTMIIGCGGGAPAPVIDPNNVSAVWPGYMKITPNEPAKSFASGTATSKDPQFAVKKAKGVAETELAAEISALIQDRMRTITEEAGLGDDAQFRTKSVNATESIVNQVLKGFRIREKEFVREGKGYRAFVLLEVPKVLADEALIGAVSSDQEMHDRFMASKTFKDIESRFK
jgi:hypothetical protein